MKSLFGRNISILRGGKAIVLSKSTPTTGLSAFLLVHGLLIIYPLFENLS